MSPKQQQLKQLKAVVDRLFSDEFLFHRDNRAWQAVVTDADGAPLEVDAVQLGTFTDVANCASIVPATMADEIGAAAASSDVVEVTKHGDGHVTLRRKHPLSLENDPDLRTVFVKPVHYDATDDQIRDFFSAWGKVVGIERRQFLAGTAGAEKVRPSTFVVFSTRAEAEGCVAAKPSYGTGTTPLGALFVPQLTVTMKAAHEAAQAALLQRSSALAARKELADAAAAVAGTAALESNKVLNRRCTCKASDLPAGTTWQTLKAKIGNLSLSHPELKKKIGLVHVDGSTGYIVCKTPEAAQQLLVAYGGIGKRQNAAGFAEELRAAVPRLHLLEGAEEDKFVRDYPSLVVGAVQKKVHANAKRERD